MLPTWLNTITTQLCHKGINLFGIVSGESYSTYLDGCQSIIVFANGGTELWDSFINDITQRPQNLSKHEHPFDDFVHRLIQEADPNPPSTRRWIRCADTEETFIDMRPLAQNAGIGTHSHMGMLIHPEYGLWVGLRGILLTTEYIPPSSQLSANPCSTCIEKPCISSCVGNAVTKMGWNIQLCAETHTTSQKCSIQCASRLACPIGIKHKHSPLQHMYHSNRHEGRKELSHRLKIEDTKEGENLQWKNWTH